jgi:hypothetical protein
VVQYLLGGLYNPKLKWADITDTTSANGVATYDFGKNAIVICANSIQGGLFVIPGATYNSRRTWSFKVIEANGAAYSNKSVTIVAIYYYPN